MTKNKEFQHQMAIFVSLLETTGVATKAQAKEMTKLVAHTLYQADVQELSVYEYIEAL